MKRVFGMLAAFVLCITLAGCGSSATASEWERRGQFTDENMNYLSITDASEADLGEEYKPFHISGMLSSNPYNGFADVEGNALKGELSPGYGTEVYGVSITEEGDNGLQLEMDDGRVYHFTPME